PAHTTLPTNMPSSPQARDVEPVVEPKNVESGVPDPVQPPAVAQPCPEDMVDVASVCIDRFEAPNEKGKHPLLMQSAHDAEAWCKERGKRLCNEDEWVRACEGPQHLPFPYGETYQQGVCNDDKTWKAVQWGRLGRWPDDVARAEANRLDQSEPSGMREGCRSAEGVYDLTGNAGEWVIRTRDNPTNYSHVVKGCYWGKCFRPPHTPSCEYVNYGHEAGFRSYEFGFRCCKDRGAS
ncbi:MAG TPA: SUMF1/EgtB/PvdO family nonheme iron enzyme, partial [Polyangiaceae bacterium]|nr:SUMF1/EgtB/PvdO family nonheme iron enzyme [Polyangiaceae bacterium]